jgi:uncharacterized membrane protein YfcA
MIEIIAGFLIAVAVGLTGMGGGSFTTPVLVLLSGLPAAAAVGTAMIFTAILRLLAAPFYVIGRKIHLQYVKLLLLGAVPGLFFGTYFLRKMGTGSWSPVVLVIVGVMLTTSAALGCMPKYQKPSFAKENSHWLPWLALPIGIETGFSSAGAGALGTVLLLNYSELTAATVVGTDLLFGIVLALLGGAFHLGLGDVNGPILVRLLSGGVPGVLLGCLLARKVPGRKLRVVVALIAIVLGLQLVWSGTRGILRQQDSAEAPHARLARSSSAASFVAPR